MVASRARALVATLGFVVVTTMLPPLWGPATAASGCTSEVPQQLPPSACDDSTPPDTTLTVMNPPANSAGWTRSSAVEFTFEVSGVTDGDADSMELECKLTGPSQAHDWTRCTSPRSYSGLVDSTGEAPYIFEVRAYDSVDRGIPYDDPWTIGPDDEVPDIDATPARRAWRQDTDVPETLLFKGPRDTEGTGLPVASQPRVTYHVTSTEDNADYRCRLDGAVVGCQEGSNTYRGLSGGVHVFNATAIDRAGNEDQSPATKKFISPYNLSKGTDWRRRKSRGYFAGDYLEARQRGAITKFRARDVREILLIAPSGSGLGKIRVRVANGPAKTINLGRKADAKRRTYEVRGRFAPLVSGPVLIESLSRRKPVRVDALVFPDER